MENHRRKKQNPECQAKAIFSVYARGRGVLGWSKQKKCEAILNHTCTACNVPVPRLDEDN